mmetsp:Transcript_25532/g.43359  ORF Transcript_25532/g.43359 Transcript_25532/m.43359 type:complete len:138 (+) Transcript_25532:556-969(+)
MKSTSRSEYAEYLALTTSSAVAAANTAGSLCSLPQHFIYPEPEPQGHGTTAAPPNPDVDPLFFFLDFCFLASSCSSDGGLREEHDDNGDVCRVFTVKDDTQGVASVMRRMNSLLVLVMVQNEDANKLYGGGDGSLDI